MIVKISTDIVQLSEIQRLDYTPKTKVLGISYKITEALYIKESGAGRNCGRGKSGEIGCFQYLKSTWEARSIKHLGKIVPQTKENEELVTLLHVDYLTRKGYTPYQVALEHNQGDGKKPCRKGISKLNVPYNSCEYAQSIQSMVK